MQLLESNREIYFNMLIKQIEKTTPFAKILTNSLYFSRNIYRHCEILVKDMK
jgi:hypothetical protein